MQSVKQRKRVLLKLFRYEISASYYMHLIIFEGIVRYISRGKVSTIALSFHREHGRLNSGIFLFSTMLASFNSLFFQNWLKNSCFEPKYYEARPTH